MIIYSLWPFDRAYNLKVVDKKENYILILQILSCTLFSTIKPGISAHHGYQAQRGPAWCVGGHVSCINTPQRVSCTFSHGGRTTQCHHAAASLREVFTVPGEWPSHCWKHLLILKNRLRHYAKQLPFSYDFCVSVPISCLLFSIASYR